MSLVYFILLGVLGVALLLTFVRLMRGPSLPDRVMSLDLSIMCAVGIITVFGIAWEISVLLDVAIILALISFISTVAFAHYIEKRVRP
jgi:multicomponent Na+:H+ antiporter subunit F